MENKYFFAIDRGGTFTDVLAIRPDRTIRTLKLLSEDPARYADAPREGIRRILAEDATASGTAPATGSDGLVETERIGRVQMGTTVATNALLERAGEPVGLLVNRGFRDLLEIGNQARPKIFDLDIRRPSNLYQEVVEIGGRLVPAKEGECELEKDPAWRRLPGAAGTGDYLEIEPLDPVDIRQRLDRLIAEHNIRSVAVVLAHSYACPEHELRVGRIAREAGMRHVTLSHEAMPMCRMVPRGFTGCAEAYLTPHVQRYLDSFRSGFREQLAGVEVLFMQSDGGLTRMEQFRGARAILSGPAGGVVGYAKTGRAETAVPLIGFDMGGTSTDVSRYDDRYEHVIESTTAGVTIQAPQLDINTVAAGGGSRLFFRSGLFVVGPESAGAHPGPACYRKGGPLTVTDANLVLGHLQPEYFPCIFGASETEPLDAERAGELFAELRAEINAYQWAAGKAASPEELSVEQVAAGFVRVANEAMCRPIRALTQSRGFDTAAHALACFGGAGGQHACSIARELGMSVVLVHKYAGILSAYGMALADVVQEDQRPCGLEYCRANGEQLERLLAERAAVCRGKLREQGFTEEQIEAELFLHMRYEGTDGALMCTAQKGFAADVPQDERVCETLGDFRATFLERYRSEYGFVLQGRRIIVDDVRCRASGRTDVPQEADIAAASGEPIVDGRRPVYFDGHGYVETPVYLRTEQGAGHRIRGPAIIIDALSTILIEPDCVAEITRRGDLRIEIGAGVRRVVGEQLDAVQLSIFSHRFMSIAEQMGRILQRTSISTNIKERLDFSCALFGPDGGLVSNAPHIPVHLGSMQEAVQYQLRLRGETLCDGDVLLSNHPQAGGSHLPDLTVITPVFHKNSARPVFFVASRGHHADIGGITPGSMPPHSTSLAQEGAAFMSFLLVQDGHFQEAAVSAHLCTASPAAGSVGTRNLSDNLSDLRAQVAANHKGIQLVRELIDAYGLSVVQAYMLYIQQNAELAVRDMLREIAAKTATADGRPAVLRAEQFMDDGAAIRLSVSIDADTGSAVADFSGSSTEVWGNCNAPRAITLSALIYCLRCMVGHDVPLNQGCLRPLEIRIPAGSMLDPSPSAAVVGGNVQTSQRIVDAVLQAFGWCAASQGCMNNVTLGTERWGYYETVAGGSGAGPGWQGTGGVHTHMTNTRITDPEILETRYPMVLRRFSLRRDASGGRGRWPGGEGVERELWFRKPVTLSVLTERRVLRPYGMAGGEPGKCGENYLLRKDGRLVRLGGKTAVAVEAGDMFRMLTPGGGGYGVADGEATEADAVAARLPLERGSLYDYKQAQNSV